VKIYTGYSRGNLKLNALEGILSNNIISYYGQILRTNKERIPKKVLNIKVKGKCPRGRLR
jgi:hypothetical protein